MTLKNTLQSRKNKYRKNGVCYCTKIKVTSRKHAGVLGLLFVYEVQLLRQEIIFYRYQRAMITNLLNDRYVYLLFSN